MKGLVLSGGAGTRLRPITFSMAKQLVPVANQPILFYGLNDLAVAGITDVGIVISPQTGEEIRQAVGDGSSLGLGVTYIVQDQPLGLAHALATALPFIDGDQVLMYLGDNLIKQGVADVVSAFESQRPNCQILLTEVDNPQDFGVAELDSHGQVTRLVEKPYRPASNLALVGVYLFDSAINEAVAAIEPSSRGELEITDAIQYLVDQGHNVRSSVVTGWWKDTGKKEDLLHANELVLADLTEKIEGDLVDCRIRGAVRIDPGVHAVDCTFTGPAVIGADAHLTRVGVGPNTAVGPSARLSDARVEHSIIMERAEIHGWRLRNSLVGRDALLHGSAPPGYAEVTIGERSEIVGE